MAEYCLYGESWKGIDHGALLALNREEGTLLARAENSGGEGCYTEVAKWNHDRGRWERFCFLKFLGGEDTERENWPPEQLAEHYAREINKAAGEGHDRLPLIHILPDAE